MENHNSTTPHVLIFPLPAQGHITPMLNLAELFCLAKFKVTFLITAQLHQRLTNFTDTETRLARYPSFKFKVIPDAPPPKQWSSHEDLMNWIFDMIQGVSVNAKPLLEEMINGFDVTCLVVDGWLKFAYDIANEGGLPVISFRCPSACCVWAYFHIPELIEVGEVPFQDEIVLPGDTNLSIIGHIVIQYSNTCSRASVCCHVVPGGFRFKSVAHGLPDDRPRIGKNTSWEVLQGFTLNAEPLLRKILLIGTSVACLIVDGWISFSYDLAKKAEITVIAFRCYSACYHWLSSYIPQLIENESILFKDEHMDELVKNVPGMDSFLRYRDLPSFCRAKDKPSCQNLQQAFASEIYRTKQAYGLILNTFEELEGPFLSLLRSQCSRVYSIGPLHTHIKHRLAQENTTVSNSSSSLWEVDQSCLSWLDQKPDKSVIYVGFGSLTVLEREQIMEIWEGLVQSNKYFLWVIRPDLIIPGENEPPTPDTLLEGTKERGCIVKWAPQEAVLAHKAIGGFLTHSGWNSTLESITAGVPMLCWPYFADQQVNSRHVSEVWRIGIDMKDTCDRNVVAKMVGDLMDRKNLELDRSMARMSDAANRSVTEGGSSYCNLDSLMQDIRKMSLKCEN